MFRTLELDRACAHQTPCFWAFATRGRIATIRDGSVGEGLSAIRPGFPAGFRRFRAASRITP
jgi:hypothetical protein